MGIALELTPQAATALEAHGGRCCLYTVSALMLTLGVVTGIDATGGRCLGSTWWARRFSNATCSSTSSKGSPGRPSLGACVVMT
eukprot:2403494-Pyramimonas_sp.AAC.1